MTFMNSVGVQFGFLPSADIAKKSLTNGAVSLSNIAGQSHETIAQRTIPNGRNNIDSEKQHMQVFSLLLTTKCLK